MLAQLALPIANTCFALRTPGTAVGSRGSCAPPKPILPQHATELSSRSAHACRSPSASSLTPWSFGVTGFLASIVVPLPSSPAPFAPQQRAVASDITAQLACAPTTIVTAVGFAAIGG